MSLYRPRAQETKAPGILQDRAKLTVRNAGRHRPGGGGVGYD